MVSALSRPTLVGALLVLAATAGCRGDVSSEPPVHLNPNMDQQSRFDPQEPNPMFADGRAMRPPVAGAVAIGSLNEDDHYYRGKVGEAFADNLPAQVTLDAKLLARGQERFNIYCSACHGRTGVGDGLVIERGMLKPPSYYEDRVKAFPIGQIFDVISNGVRNMSGYRAQIPVQDRWAIAAYVRALQLSGSGTLDEVPADMAAQKGWKAP